MRRLKDFAKKFVPASWIFFYHSMRAALKLGIVPELLRTRRNRRDVIRLGAEAGWNIPSARLDASSVCYCIGCGEDISFDLQLIDRYGCTVYAFDPTPRAVAYVKKHASGNPRYKLAEIAIWDKQDVVRFYEPADQRGVSHSITNLEATCRFIEVPARRLSQLVGENGHTRIRLLKMDIEGAEHTVIRTVLEDRLDVSVLCVEFDELARPNPQRIAQIHKTIRSLLDAGYEYFWIEGSNFTFVRPQAANLP